MLCAENCLHALTTRSDHRNTLGTLNSFHANIFCGGTKPALPDTTVDLSVGAGVDAAMTTISIYINDFEASRLLSADAECSVFQNDAGGEAQFQFTTGDSDTILKQLAFNEARVRCSMAAQLILLHHSSNLGSSFHVSDAILCVKLIFFA